MSGIRIEKVKTKKDFMNFIKFPWKVYKDYPNWVPPLIIDMKEKLNPKKNPFFDHSEMELFLAYKDNEISGRIAAIIDNNHNEFHNEKIVFFGLYESIDDLITAKALLSVVSEWGKDRGMKSIRGPMNLSMNDECAFLLEGFDSPPVYMMPYTPPYYLGLMEKCGLEKAKDLFAYIMDRSHETTKKVKMIEEQIKNQTTVSLRNVNKNKVNEETEKIMHIYNNAWGKNWGFVPWTIKEMRHIFRKLKIFADPKIIILAEDKGKAIGFAFALPNYNEVIMKMNGRIFPFGIFKFLYYRRKIKGVRAVVFGILKEYRSSGISYLLYSQLEKNIRARNYQWCETSWQLEDNEAVNKFTESIGGKLYKKYRIYEKKLY